MLLTESAKIIRIVTRCRLKFRQKSIEEIEIIIDSIKEVIENVLKKLL